MLLIFIVYDIKEFNINQLSQQKIMPQIICLKIQTLYDIPARLHDDDDDDSVEY